MSAPRPPATPSGEELLQHFERVANKVQETQQLEADIARKIQTYEGARTINKLNQLRLIREAAVIKDTLARGEAEMSTNEQVKMRAAVAACEEWEQLK